MDYVDGNLNIWYSLGNYTTNPAASFPYAVSYAGGVTSKNTSYGLPTALQYDGEIVNSPNMLFISSSTSDTFNSSSNPNHRGQTIITPYACRAVGIWGHIDSDAAGDLLLYDSDGATVLQTIAITDPDIRGATTGAPQYYLFTTPQNLVKGSKYRVVLRPSTTTNISGYYVNYLDDGSIKGIDQMDLGQNSVYTTSNGTPTNEESWTNTTNKRFCMGLIIDALDIPTGGITGSILGSSIVRRC